MTTRRFTPTEVAAKLALGRSLEAEGHSMAQVCRRLGVNELTYLRWWKKYGELTAPGVVRLQDLAEENARLRAAVEKVAEALAALQPVVGPDADVRPHLLPVQTAAGR